MFITCQECNTTFRLDESLLKPTGSKVRCSQCHHTFVARPPSGSAPVPPSVVDAPLAAAVPPPAPEQEPEPEAQELDGIDLAELDSILEGKSEFAEPEESQDAGGLNESPEAGAAEMDALEDIDLDLDFDAALESAEEEAVEEAPVEASDDDELDLEMDFEIDDDTLIAEPLEADEAELSADPTGATDSDLADDLDLSLDDLDIDLEGEAGGEAPVAAEASATDDLDLTDMEFDLDGEAPVEEVHGEEPELSLDAADDAAAPVEAEAPADDLDLDLDFDLDDIGAEPKAEPADTELSLDDDFDLSLDAQPVGADETPASEELELDLDSDFDLDMDTLPGESEAGPQEPSAVVTEEPEEDGFDLGDLDTLLDEGEETGASIEDGLGDLDDLEFELEMEDAPKGETPAPAAADDELEDLDFDLDTEFVDNSTMSPAEPTVAASASDTEEDEEIDLSDIEQMLEDDSQASGTTTPKSAIQEDLGLGGESDEIDLTEFESALDSADDVTDDLTEDTELELDFDLDGDKPNQVADEISDDLSLELDLEADEKGEAPEELDLELDLEMDDQPKGVSAAEEELDLSDLSDLVEDVDGGQKPNTITDGDIELEFQIEEDEGAAADQMEAMPAGQTGGQRVDQIPVEEALDTLVVEEKAAAKPPVRPKKKRSSLMPVLILLLLLCGLAAAGYYAVTQMGIEIPYVSDYLNPKPKDPAGIMKLTTTGISAKFVENSQAGRLFVISGKVRNGYGEPRNQIRLQGKLFTKGKVLIKSEYSYAGEIINDQEIASLPIAEIKQRLNAVSPAGGAAKGVLPGQNVAFMVVFSDLPPADQLDEYAVELVSSAKAQ